MDYNFEWDPAKARRNQTKHAVSFEQAATVFHDPRALSVYDTDHSAEEDRWITLGLSASGGLLAVHHTFEQAGRASFRVRIFSARKATPREAAQYAE